MPTIATPKTVSDLQLRLARKMIDMIGERSLPAGTHLREEDLAKHFKVSRSPVRGTLNLLASLGVVERRVNRGYFLLKNGDEYTDISLGLPQTSDDQICEKIARDWFERKLDREISEAEVRRRYDLGRSTASRILQKLSDEGVISRSPGYGWRFEPTLDTPSAHDESYDFRIMNEPAAILLPSFQLNLTIADHIRSRHEATLNANGGSGDISILFGMDAEFHEFIAQCSGNRFLIAAITGQNRLRRLVEYASLTDTGRLQDSCLEHLAILDALQSDDRKRAARLMREHLRKAKNAGPSYAETRRQDTGWM